MKNHGSARTYLTVNDALPDLARHVLNGEELGSRKGERVLERLHQQITLTEPWDRYPRLGLRRASLPAQIAETMWILAGRNDVKWLSYYLPRAVEFSDDGETWRGGYGPRIRRYGDPMLPGRLHLDQLDAVVRELRESPTSRRAVIGIWDASMDARRENEDPWKDVPCNDIISFQSRLGELHAHVFVRSNDLMWGWSGINAFEWSVLQEVIAGILGIEVGTLTFSISSLHAYDRHWEKLRKIGAAYPAPEEHFDPLDAFDVPRLTKDETRPRSVAELDEEIAEWFKAEAKIREAGSFDAAWSAANSAATSSLFTSFLQVIAAARFQRPDDLPSRVLRESLKASPRAPFAVDEEREEIRAKNFGGVIRANSVLTPAGPEPGLSPLAAADTAEGLAEEIAALHDVKHAAYGDSWKRRGESLGILANIARKTDRLGKTDDVETALDTAVDLLVYLVKYEAWLRDVEDGGERSDGTEWVNRAIRDRIRAGVGGSTTGEDFAADLARRIDDSILSGGWTTSDSAERKGDKVRAISSLALRYLLELWEEGR